MKNHLRTEPAVDTAPKQRGIPFKPGVSGNPSGRPRGARSKLGERFLDDLIDTWDEHGTKALAASATQEPTQFCKMVAGILPKEVLLTALNVNASVSFADVEEAKSFLAAYRRVRDHKSDEAPLIELNPEAEVAWRVDDDD